MVPQYVKFKGLLYRKALQMVYSPRPQPAGPERRVKRIAPPTSKRDPEQVKALKRELDSGLAMFATYLEKAVANQQPLLDKLNELSAGPSEFTKPARQALQKGFAAVEAALTSFQQAKQTLDQLYGG